MLGSQSPGWKERFGQVLIVVTLAAVAVAQPMYSVMVKEGSFFVGRELILLDGLIIVLAFSVLPALFLGGLVWLAGHAHRWIRAGVFYGLVLVLATGVALPFFKGIYLNWGPPALSLLVQTLIALAIGAGVTFLLGRFVPARQFVQYLSVGIFVFPLYFLFSYPFLQDYERDFKPPEVASPIPIVMIVLDEFPVMALMDGVGGVDEVLYPNFAELTKTATWYRRAISPHADTAGALPVILSGRLPRTREGAEAERCLNPPANTRVHDKNMFTLLADSYDLQVYEAYVFLCPTALCMPEVFDLPPSRRLNTLVSLSKRYISNVLYKAGTFNTAFDNFRRARVTEKAMEPYHQGDLDDYAAFLQGLENAENPNTFHFSHPLLPHTIWEFYPSGRHYSNLPELEQALNNCDNDASLPFCKNRLFATVNYQRHLLQVGHADTLIGQAVSALKQAGLYDDALVIVTADHGASFQPGEPRRKVTGRNFSDIMSVPLFIKYPGQVQGVVDDRRVDLSDILPTVARVLNVEVPWHMDGQPLTGSAWRERTGHFVCSPDEKLTFTTDQIDEKLNEALRHKIARFGSGKSAQSRLFEVGNYSGLVGSTLTTVPEEDRQYRLILDSPSMRVFEEIDPQALLPLHLRGRVQVVETPKTGAAKERSIDLAVRVNGQIQALSETFTPPGSREIHFSILVPESAYRPGANTVDFLKITGPASRPDFSNLPLGSDG